MRELDGQCGAQSIEWFIEGSAFWQKYDLAPRPPPFPPLPSARCLSLSVLLCIASRASEGEGWAWSRIVWPKSCPSMHHSILSGLALCRRVTVLHPLYTSLANDQIYDPPPTHIYGLSVVKQQMNTKTLMCVVWGVHCTNAHSLPESSGLSATSL